MTRHRRSIAWEATGCVVLTAATVAAAEGPAMPRALVVGAAVALLVAFLGLGVSIAGGGSGSWSPLALAVSPLLGVSVAASFHAPGARVLALAAPPLSIIAATMWWGRLHRSPSRRARTALVAVVITVVVADLVARDPYRELNCRPVCPQNPLVVGHRPTLLVFSGWILLISVVAFVVSETWRQRERGEHSRLTPFLATAMVSTAIGRLVRTAHHPDDLVPTWLALTAIVSLTLVAAGTLAPALRSLADRRRVRDWARDIGRPGVHADAVSRLRVAVGDPELRVLADAEHDPRLATTTLVRNGRPIAVIEHRAESADRVRAALSPMMVAHVDNDLLLERAEQQLVELQRARTAAIQRVDATRSALQQDLHDGAQQQLIALGMELASLATVAEPRLRPQLEQATSHAAAALEQLRAIAHGVLPPVLETEGLCEAVRSMVEDADLPVDLALPDFDAARHPGDVERAAFLFVAACVDEAAASGATRVSVRIASPPDLCVEVAHDGVVDVDRAIAADRIDAVGGTCTTCVESGRVTHLARRQ